MRMKAIKSKWLPPLSLRVHLQKAFAVKGGLYPLICCKLSKVYIKTEKHRYGSGSGSSF